MHINFPCLNFLWVDNWNFLVFGIFEDEIKAVWSWVDLATVFCHLHWASKSILGSLAKWLPFQKCRAQPFCYLIRKCSDQNLWTCLVCVTKSISNGFKYFRSSTYFSKQFCFLLQLLGLDWQCWIKVHGSSSVQLLPFLSLTHLSLSSCFNIWSVISGVVTFLDFPRRWLVCHLSHPLNEKDSKNIRIISFSKQNQASALPYTSFLKFCFHFLDKTQFINLYSNVGKPQANNKMSWNWVPVV